MGTKEQLFKRLKEDIEAFGTEREVYAWFQFEEGIGNVLYDYSLEPKGKCIDQETLGNLLDLLEE